MAADNTQSITHTDQSTHDLGNWLSTYGLVTVEKILDRYNVKIARLDLIKTLKNPAAMLTKLIQTPLKNVFNGLVLQQAKDYQSYIEKLFIDYLLSGNSDEESESITKEDIEQARQNFLQLTIDFQKTTHMHEKLIADSQTLLIEFFKINKLDDRVQIDPATLAKLKEYHFIAIEVGAAIKNYRTEFSNTIKHVNELFYALGTYQPNPEQLAINQVGMDFDTNIG